MTKRPSRRGARSLSWRDVALVGIAGLLPFLSFLAVNAGELVQIGRLGVAAVVSTAVVLGVLLAVLGLRPSLESGPTAVATAGVVVWFWNSEWLAARATADLTTRLVALALWLVVAVAIALVLYRVSRRETVRTWFLLVVSILAGLLVAQAVIGGGGRETAAPPDSTEETPLQLVRQPNIYFFLLDEYARADALQTVLGLDNTDFVTALRERGMTVADGSFSGYAETPPSLASLFAADYVLDGDDLLTGAYAGFADRIVNDTTVVRRLRASGYSFVYAPTGMFAWSTCEAGNVDLCLQPEQLGVALDEQTSTLLSTTPLGLMLPTGTPVTDPISVLDELERHRAGIQEPFFLFAHILSPHPSWRFADNCVPYDIQRSASFPRSATDRDHYARDLMCLNAQVIEAVDRIQASDPDAIVIVQSDHGSKFLSGDDPMPLKDWPELAVHERFANLDAERLPEECVVPTGSRSTVNTFRVVFACLEGDSSIELDNRSFLNTGGDQLEEVPDAADRLGTPMQQSG